MYSHSKKGITLVELVVAMTLTSIFAVLCVMLINPIERTYKSTLKLARAQLLADTLIDSIRKECDDVKHDDKASVWITDLSGDDSALLSTTAHASNDTSGNTLVIRRNNNFAESIYAGAEINADTSNVTGNPLTPTGTAHAVETLKLAGTDNLKSGYVHYGYYQGKEDDDGFYPIAAYDYTNPVMAKTYGNFTVELHFDQLARKDNKYPAYVMCTVKIMENGKKVYSRSAVLCFAANGSGHGSGSGGGGNHNVTSVRDIEVKIVWDDENNTSARPAGGVVITLWDKDKTNSLGICTVSDVKSKSIQTFKFKNISTAYAIKDLSITQSADPAADGYLKAAISKNSSGFVIKNKYSNLPVTLLSGTAFNAIVQKDKVQHVVFGSEAGIRARVSLTGITPVRAAISGSTLSDRYKLYYVSSSNTAYILSEDGYFIANPDCSHMFEGCKNLTSITWNAGTENNGEFLINTSDTTNMASMFKDCTAMTTFNVKDLVQSSCLSTASMFEGCTAAQSINLISTWNTSGVTNMSRMFFNYAAKHNKKVSVSIDISSFRFNNCEDMSFMFANDSDKGTITNITFPLGTATNLTQYPKLRTMEKMFYGCGGLQNITNLNNLNCPVLKKADKMFDNCSNIKVLNLENFKMPQCEFEDKYNVGAFSGCNNLNTINLNGWDISGDTTLRDFFSRKKGQLKTVYLNDCTLPSSEYSIEGLFYDSTSVSTVGMRGFVTDKCTTIRSLFYNCTSLKTLDIGSWNWNTSSVKYWRTVFYNSRVQSLDLSSLSFASAVDLSYIFQKASSKTIILPAPGNTGLYECPDCISVIGMFLECSNLTEARNFKNYSFPAEMKYGNIPDEHGSKKMFGSGEIFKGCTSLTTIDISGFKMEKATSVASMFEGCVKLGTTEQGVFTWNMDMPAIETTQRMFAGCTGLTNITITGNMPKCKKTIGMFMDCHNLTKVNLSGFNTPIATDCQNMFENCYRLSIAVDDLRGWFDSWDTTTARNLTRLFYNCCYDVNGDNSVEKNMVIDISTMSFNKITRFIQMFSCDDPDKDCLETIFLPVGDKGKAPTAQSMTGMFMSRKNLATIENLGDFRPGTGLKKIKSAVDGNTTETENGAFYEMFDGASRLTSIDLSGFTFSKYTAAALDPGKMFFGCSNLETIYVSSTQTYTGTIFVGTEIFNGCTKLVGHGTGVDDFDFFTHGDHNEYARVNQSGYPGYFTIKP